MLIKDMLDKLNEFQDDMKIKVSDDSYIIDDFGSDRGDYYDMYIGCSKNPKEDSITTVGEFKSLLNEALEKGIMEGYKGEKFAIQECTDVTLGSYGCCGTSISDIREKYGIVYIVYKALREVWE